MRDRLGKNKPGAGKSGGKGKGKAPKKEVATPLEPPKAAPEVAAWIKNRPKGGVKVLGGIEGSMGKRAAEAEPSDAPAAKK